jgi:hypothetical protein
MARCKRRMSTIAPALRISVMMSLLPREIFKAYDIQGERRLVH